MLVGIDHLVILVSDLESAIKDYREQGFVVVPGGRHPTHTHNALIGLSDGSYLELLAFYEPYPESKWWAKVAQGGGLIAVCLQTDNLRDEIATFRAAGVQMSDPKPLSRVRPDGYELKWILSINEGEYPDLVPFLIEDETPREERVPKQAEHRNEATGINSVTFVVDDLASLRPVLANIFGQAGEPISADNAKGNGVRFSTGAHLLDFVTAEDADKELSRWLEVRGSSPYTFDLKVACGGILTPEVAVTS